MLLEPLERACLIWKRTVLPAWTPDQFKAAAREGKKRWNEIEELFSIKYSMFSDAVSVISPGFQLVPAEKIQIECIDPQWKSVWFPRLAVFFVKWEQCPITNGLPNPYEPWVEIWEHGGDFQVEHGQFVDIWNHEGERVNGLVVRRA